MTTDEAFSRWGLAPPISELNDIRRALSDESKRRRSDTEIEEEDDDSTDDLLLLLCVQLFAARQVEDSLHIWRAKQGDFDASLSIDGEFLCGAGVEETRQFLLSNEAPQAIAALEYIDNIDWSHFTPDGHLAHYRRYFSD
jgi:hypothetical protein